MTTMQQHLERQRRIREASRAHLAARQDRIDRQRRANQAAEAMAIVFSSFAPRERPRNRWWQIV